jgi:hypothetical protein
MPKKGPPQTAPGAGDAHIRPAALIARQPREWFSKFALMVVWRLCRGAQGRCEG